MFDKDYIKYLLAEGKVKPEEAILEYLDHICTLLYEMKGKPNLMGQYKIQPQGGKGYPKGPPNTNLNVN